MRLKTLTILALAALLLTGCFARSKYENPISADTGQPDKVLFDSAINDLERGRYAVARLTLQTLINTYDTSEYIAKAKLALADTWFREGGSNGLAQAEAEYKDFILFYPLLPEAAEAQEKICTLHFRQLEKPDRDRMHAVRADEECRQVVAQFPNSRFAPEVEQTLRNVQEVIAEGEFRVGEFYYKKGSLPAAINRHENTVDHYPLYSKADQALYHVGEMYTRAGPRFREQSVDAYQRIVRDYPLSDLTENAKRRLQEMEAEIPEPDPVALARMEYERENSEKLGITGKFWGIFRHSPNVKAAAKSGTPASEPLRPTIPLSVPQPGRTAGNSVAEVTASQATDSTALDTQPDARQSRNP
jgi:outer membrane protein assembly factor BamD